MSRRDAIQSSLARLTGHAEALLQALQYEKKVTMVVSGSSYQNDNGQLPL
jgi:hypothetical protein